MGKSNSGLIGRTKNIVEYHPFKNIFLSDDKTNIKNPYAESDLSSTAGKEIKPDEE